MQLNAYIDGACEPVNPGGTASYGVVVYGSTKYHILFSTQGIVGRGKFMSNNVAEYAALGHLLEWYRDNRDKYKEYTIIVHSDSQLLVNQMNGNWNVHGGLYLKYYDTATMLIAQWKPKIQYKWIPREENTVADMLSVKALAAYNILPRPKGVNYDS